MKGDSTDDYIPQTMIPSEHHLIDKTMFPPSDTDYKYEYDGLCILFSISSISCSLIRNRQGPLATRVA